MNSVTVTVLLTDLLGIHQHSINMVRFVRFTFAAFFVCSILYFTQVAGEIDIVPPYPINPVVIEGEKAELTCVAYDIENVTKPENMTFLKIINTFGDTKPIPDGGNYTFTKKTELNDLRIVVTMVIKKMYADMAGVYRCQADRPNDKNTGRPVRPAAHEFRVHYVAQKSLPQLNYSSNVSTEFGNPASLHCELVQGDQKVSTNIVKLDKIAWFKNDVRTGNEVARLDEKLPNINLKMDSPSDAGKYTCRLFTTLFLTRKYNISGTITVAIKPRFPPLSSSNVGDDGYEITLDDNEIIRKKGESAKFNCIAEGNPITIIWKKTPRSSEKTEVLNQTELTKNGSSSRYKFSNDKLRLKGFWMEIPETNFDDRGEYSCCVEIDNNQRCQKFTLRVKDPLGWLWPLIGIIIQAILIVLILVIAHYCKSGGAKRKPVKQTDLSYTFTDDGGKGHIRLRNTGARTG